MVEPPFDLSKAHRWFAVECNNNTWGLLEKKDRSEAEAQKLVHMAHAACFHWLNAGNEINHQRALVLLAVAHAEVGHAAAAIEYSNSANALHEHQKDQLEDWDEAFTVEAAARAHASAGQKEAALDLKAKARRLGDALGQEDKEVFDSWFNAGNWHGID